MDLFVKKDSTVNVDVFAYEEDGKIFATNDKSELPKTEKLQVQEIQFIFRRPSYQDSSEIFSRAQNKHVAATEEKPVTIDANNFNSAVLYTLLSDWSIKDENGKKVPVTPKSINNLQPTIARAAVAGCLQQINI